MEADQARTEERVGRQRKEAGASYNQMAKAPAKKGTMLKKKPEDETEEQSLGRELEELKKLVRFITGSSSLKTKAAFTHDQRANRLRGLAIYGHNPAIRAIPCIPAELHKETYLAILQQKKRIQECAWEKGQKDVRRGCTGGHNYETEEA